MESKNNKPIKTAVIYIRTFIDGSDYSSEIKAQLEAAHKFAEENNIKIVRIFQDKNTRDMENYQLDIALYEAMTFCVKYSVDSLITYQYDTLAEHTSEYWHAKTFLENNDVSVLFASGNRYQIRMDDEYILREAKKYKEAIIKKTTLDAVSKKKKLPKK